MKSTLGTSLALASVLIAGTAAAAVNTQTLTESTKVSPVGVSATVLLPPTDVQVDDPTGGTSQVSATPSPQLSQSPITVSNTSNETLSPANEPSPTSPPAVVSPNPGQVSAPVDYDEEDDEYDDEDEDDD